MSLDGLKATVQLAVMTCACDGSIDDCEDSLVEEWIDGKCNRLPSLYGHRLREDLEQTKKSAEKGVLGSGLSLKKVCDQLSREDDAAIRYDAMELCLRVAQVDGLGAEDEMRFLMSVGRWLELDYEKFREMRDKILPVELYDSVDVDFLIGLHLEMTVDEKLKHLTREYKRWNELTTHSNAKKREQAKSMIEFIANRRGELREEKRRDRE